MREQSAGDVGSFDEFVERVREAQRELGANRFDFLVNNAGTSYSKSIEDTTEADLDPLYNVHFKGVFFLTQKLLPPINDGGRIVNISSAPTQRTLPNRPAYGAMKAAVETLTRYMAREFGHRRAGRAFVT